MWFNSNWQLAKVLKLNGKIFLASPTKYGASIQQFHGPVRSISYLVSRLIGCQLGKAYRITRKSPIWQVPKCNYSRSLLNLSLPGNEYTGSGLKVADRHKSAIGSCGYAVALSTCSRTDWDVSWLGISRRMHGQVEASRFRSSRTGFLAWGNRTSIH